MSFEQPWGWAFAALLPAIVLLYLLKLKRVDTPISSVMLWRRSLQDLKADSPFQKLRRNLLLFLQLLATAVGVFALAAPLLHAVHPDRESVIVLLDTSASMGATDVAPNRLEVAKDIVRDMIDSLGYSGVMSLITFADQARSDVPLTGDRRQLHSALDRVRIQQTPTRLDEAMGLAFAAAREAKNPRVVIISDGAFSSGLPDAPDNIPIQLTTVGTGGKNIAITEVAARENFDAEGLRELLVGVSAIGAATGQVYLSLYALEPRHDDEQDQQTETQHDASGELVRRGPIDARRVQVESGRTTSVLFRDTGTYPPLLEIVLDSDDDLSVDNHAWVVMPTDEPMDVLLVTDGYYALEKVLPLAPGVRVSRVAPENYVPVSNADVVIFDRFRPPALGPGSYVFLGEVPPIVGCSRGEDLDSPAIVWADRFHPLTRYVNFAAITLAEAPMISLPPWAEVVVRARETPLIATLERGAMHAVVIAFHPSDSDWPFRVSFPIFFGNVLDYFRTHEGSRRTLYKTGEPIPIISNIEGEVHVTQQDGEQKTVAVKANEPSYVTAPPTAGLMQFSGPRQEDRRFTAVNLASYDESNITPGKSIQFGDVTISAEKAEDVTAENIWWPLLWVAFAIILIEWWVYSRRARYTF